MIPDIYQIHIAIKGFKPKIWRRILVKSDVLLPNLHKILQTTMGWTNVHRHQFIKGRDYYASPSVAGFDKETTLDYRKIRLDRLVQNKKDKFEYEYDFGDGWLHEILLEKIFPIDSEIFYPLCLGGEMHSPKEDVGGVIGYANMLKILKNPLHEEYADFLIWVGENYDSSSFDIVEVNQLLHNKNFGCPEV